MWDIIGNVANILGIVSALVAVYSWRKSKAYSTEAKEAVKKVENFKNVEYISNVVRVLENITSNIRSQDTIRGRKAKNFYLDIEREISRIIANLPTAFSNKRAELEEIEKEIRIARDEDRFIIENQQYELLNKIRDIEVFFKTKNHHIQNQQ